MSESELYAAAIVAEKFWMHTDHIRNSIQSALRIAWIDGGLSAIETYEAELLAKNPAPSTPKGLDL